MAYGENKMNFAVGEGVNTITQQMEYDDRCFTVEVRISEKFGFVNTSITDNATGKDVTLEMTIEPEVAKNDDQLNVTLLNGDEELGTLGGE